MSWPIVGFFYPSLMFALLAIFPLLAAVRARVRATQLRPDQGRARAAADLRAPRRLLAPPVGPLRVPGRLGDHRRGPALRPPHVRRAGGVRVARDAPRWAGGSRRIRVETGRGSARVRCDPIVHFNVARALCRQGAANGRWTDWTCRSGPGGQPSRELRPVVEVDGFCRQTPRATTSGDPTRGSGGSDTSPGCPGRRASQASPRPRCTAGSVLAMTQEEHVDLLARGDETDAGVPAKVPSNPELHAFDRIGSRRHRDLAECSLSICRVVTGTPITRAKISQKSHSLMLGERLGTELEIALIEDRDRVPSLAAGAEPARAAVPRAAAARSPRSTGCRRR